MQEMQAGRKLVVEIMEISRWKTRHGRLSCLGPLACPQMLGSFFRKLKGGRERGGCEKECERAQPVVGGACVLAA